MWWEYAWSPLRYHSDYRGRSQMQDSRTGRQPSFVAFCERHGIYYGWIVVAVTCVTVLVGAGLRQVPAVVIKPLEAEFGWDRASISLAIAVSLIAYGLGSPFSGRLIDRFGPRTVTLWALGLTLVGAAGIVTIGTIWELVWWLGIVVGLGTGALALVLGATVATRWFETQRGLATGILAAGTSAGQLVFIPIMMALTLNYGWRAPIALCLATLAIVVVPLTIFLVRDKPSDVGLKPLGWRPGAYEGGSPDTPVNMSAVLRTGDFWLLAGSFFVCGVTSNGLIGTHLVPHAVEHGFSEYTAAGALALMGGMNVIGTMASGYLSDRVNPRMLAGAVLRLAIPVAAASAIGERAHRTYRIRHRLWAGLHRHCAADDCPNGRLIRPPIGRHGVWLDILLPSDWAAAASYAAGLAHDVLGDYQIAFIVAAIMGFIAAG